MPPRLPFGRLLDSTSLDFTNILLPQTSKPWCAISTRLQRCLGGSRAQTPSPQPAASPPFCSGDLVQRPESRAHLASERASERVSQSKRERERAEESRAWSEPKRQGRPIHFQHWRHTSLSVVHTPPAFRRLVTVSLTHPAVCRRRRLERRGRLCELPARQLPRDLR